MSNEKPAMCGHPSYVGTCNYCRWRANEPLHPPTATLTEEQLADVVQYLKFSGFHAAAHSVGAGAREWLANRRPEATREPDWTNRGRCAALLRSFGWLDSDTNFEATVEQLVRAASGGDNPQKFKAFRAYQEGQAAKASSPETASGPSAVNCYDYEDFKSWRSSEPAQPWVERYLAQDLCLMNPLCSRACEQGTYTCVVKHRGERVSGGDVTLGVDKVSKVNQTRKEPCPYKKSWCKGGDSLGNNCCSGCWNARLRKGAGSACTCVVYSYGTDSIGCPVHEVKPGSASSSCDNPECDVACTALHGTCVTCGAPCPGAKQCISCERLGLKATLEDEEKTTEGQASCIKGVIPWCTKHQPNPNGCYAQCPFCAVEELNAALSDIDRLVDISNGVPVNDPNYTTGYEAFYVPSVVVARVRDSLKVSQKEVVIDGPKKVIINGEEKTVDAKVMSFEDVVAMAGMTGTPTVVWRYRNPPVKHEGIMHPGGGTVVVADNMVFNVVHTGNT